MYRELQYKVTDLRDALSSNKICMYHKNLSAVDVFHYSWVLRPPAAEETACQSDCTAQLPAARWLMPPAAEPSKLTGG